MASLSSIARPYALAAFQTALKKQQLIEWKAMLKSASDIASDLSIIKLLTQSDASAGQLSDLFCELLGLELNSDKRNFVLLLAEHKRLLALPQIFASFQIYCDENEKIGTVKVVTAVEMKKDYQQ